MNKEALLDELYEVFKNTENEEVYEIIGKVIDFVKREVA
jgi:nucleoid DNA-binding protein